MSIPRTDRTLEKATEIVADESLTVPADVPSPLRTNLKIGLFKTMTHVKGIVYVTGLAPDLASDLARALTPVCTEVRTVTELPSGAKTVFCPSTFEQVTRLRAAAPHSAIIVVTRDPEVNDWLDSIEAGANDYCAAPFETSQLQWILQSSQQIARRAAA